MIIQAKSGNHVLGYGTAIFAQNPKRQARM
jgi:hypothetical protein